MIRLFTALCKTLFENLCDVTIFQESTNEYCSLNEACPRCGAIGKITSYGDYTRGLIYIKKGKIIDALMKPLRFKCESCGKTHALLPDVVIPYGRYALSFVLTVLVAYFERETTVVAICERFGIAVSTMYEWKKRMAVHKDLMLGLLISSKVPSLAFLKDLLKSRRLSNTLRKFYNMHNFSLMQNKSGTATRSRPP